MPQRSLREAREVLEEEVLPRLGSRGQEEARDAMEAAEQKAQEHANEYTERREQEVRAARDQALRELAAVRDGYDDLATEGKRGRLSAQGYNGRLRDLRFRQDLAEAALGKAQLKLDEIAEIEEDPLAWFDALVERHPGLRPEVPW
jgi:hypothetical protein